MAKQYSVSTRQQTNGTTTYMLRASDGMSSKKATDWMREEELKQYIVDNKITSLSGASSLFKDAMQRAKDLDKEAPTTSAAYRDSQAESTSTASATGDSSSIFGLPVQTDDRGNKTVIVGGKTYAASESNQALKDAINAAGGTTGTTTNNTFAQTLGVDNAMLDSSGTRFNTGNASMDDFLNNTYLPLLEAEFAGDPTAILNDELFDSIKERVDKAYGPIFEKELKSAEEIFTRETEGTEAEKQRALREQQLSLERGREDITRDITRTGEDVTAGKQRIARNLQEAVNDSALAMRNRQLTFAGERIKQERKLGESAALDTADLERSGARTISDLQTKGSRLETDVPYETDYLKGQYGRELSRLGSEYDKTKSDIEGERTLQYAEERKRLRELGGSLLQNPEFIS